MSKLFTIANEIANHVQHKPDDWTDMRDDTYDYWEFGNYGEYRVVLLKEEKDSETFSLYVYYIGEDDDDIDGIPSLEDTLPFCARDITWGTPALEIYELLARESVSECTREYIYTYLESVLRAL